MSKWLEQYQETILTLIVLAVFVALLVALFG